MGKKKRPKGPDLDLTADVEFDDASVGDLPSKYTGEKVPVPDGGPVPDGVHSKVLLPVMMVLGAAAFLYFILGLAATTSVWIALAVVVVLQLVSIIDDPKGATKVLNKLFGKVS